MLTDACRETLEGKVLAEGFSGTLDPYYRDPEAKQTEMKWAICAGTNRGSVASDGGSSSLGAFTEHVISSDCGLFEPNVPVNTAISLACDRMQRTRKDSDGKMMSQQVPLRLIYNISPEFCLHETDRTAVHFDVCVCYRRDTDSDGASFIKENLEPPLEVFWQTIPGEASHLQIARAICNSSIIILIISEKTFADISTLQQGSLSSAKEELANLLKQMDMILEIYEHRQKSVRVLPVYWNTEPDPHSNFELMLVKVDISKCWPTDSVLQDAAWAPLVRQKALQQLRLVDKRLACLLHDRNLDQNLGFPLKIPSLIKGRQVSQTLRACREGFTTIPSLIGPRADAGSRVARIVRNALSTLGNGEEDRKQSNLPRKRDTSPHHDAGAWSSLKRQKSYVDTVGPSNDVLSSGTQWQKLHSGPLDFNLAEGQVRDAREEGGVGRLTEAHGMMRQLLGEINEKSADMMLPLINTTSDHFDLMISYRGNTEKNTASRIYDKIMLTRISDLAQMGDKRCKIPQYARVDSHNGELDPGIARTFLDQKHIPQGIAWEQVFVSAVANSLVLVPLLSWYEKDGRSMGSVGELMALHHNDTVDIFLLEIILANTLMKLDAGSRWLQHISPIFIGKPDARGYTEFPFEKIDILPDKPSLKTCQKAANILLDGLQIPINTEMLRVMALSVKEHIKLVTARQGIKLSDLGQEDIALQSASTKLITQIPALLLCGLQQQVVIRMSTPPPSARRSVSQDSNTGSQVSVDTCPLSDSDAETSAWHVEGDVGHFEEFLRNFIIRCRDDSSDQDAQPNWRLCKLVLLVFLQHNISDMCDAESPKDDLDELRIICSANSHDFFLKEIENLLRAHTPSALKVLGFDFEKAESKDRDGKVRHDTCIFALDKHVLKILSSKKAARRRWIEEVQEKWFDPLNTDPASAYLNRAQKYLSGAFGFTVVGKLFPTSSYVVFLRMNSLTAILMREHCRVQHAIHGQQLSHKAQVGPAKKHISSSSRVSFVVSSANWHEWLSEGTCPSKHHVAEIVCGLQQIASLPPALLEDNEVPMSDMSSVEVLGKGKREASLNPTLANKLGERRVGDGGGHVEEGASSSTSSAGSDKRLGAPAGGKGKEAASMDDTVVPYFLSHIHTPKYDTHTHMNSCTHTRQQTQTHTLSLVQREWPLSPHWDALSDAHIK